LATKVSIALTRDVALERLTRATAAISEQLGAAPPALPEYDRDLDYLQAQQLTALAVWAEGVAQALTQQVVMKGQTDGDHPEPKNKTSHR
jgi:hypothetical protein